MDAVLEKALGIIKGYDGPKLRIMEVCGTHTHEIFKLGIRNILPESIELISGPGCPVCVTPIDYIDEAVYLALRENTTVCTFGDLIRVPGTEMSLGEARAKGGSVKMVYTPLDAVDYAADHPDEEIVFLAVGFETTVPSAALAVTSAKERGITNFTLLTANKTMPMAYQSLKGAADAFLYPGHVNAITGVSVCEGLKEQGVSGVVAGFTAKELLLALAVIIRRSGEGEPFFENCYPRVVRNEGNPEAMKLIDELFVPCDSEWRGLGVIKGSGLALKPEYADFDARIKYNMPKIQGRPNPACRCGEILTGTCKPKDCPLFGKVCTPEHPVGACMVSNEGSCSAYYTYDMN